MTLTGADAVDVIVAPHGSIEYLRAVQLRREVLRWPLGLEFTRQELDDEHNQHHLVIVDGEHLVACLSLLPMEDRTVKMRQVAVQPSWQRRHVGQRLVEASEKFAQAAGYEKMVLHAREAAVPFYLRLGYSIDGECFEEVGIIHFAMFKTLS